MKTRDLTMMAVFAAIIILMSFTPLGYIPLPFIKMTIIHVPVILGCLILGPKYGAGLGFLFGLTSFINNTINPAVSSFTFSPLIAVPGTDKGSMLALLVCFLPRILVGVVPYFVYLGINKLLGAKSSSNPISYAFAGISGAFTNTIGVMGLIYLLFKDAYALVRGVGTDAVAGIILGIVGFNGVIEAVGAGILVAAIGKVLSVLMKREALA